MNRTEDLERRLGDAHYRIGALDMTNSLTEARNAFLESEVSRLRIAILDNLSTLENATSRDALFAIINDVIDGLGDALYPGRLPVAEATEPSPMVMPCLDGAPTCAACVVSP